MQALQASIKTVFLGTALTAFAIQDMNGVQTAVEEEPIGWGYSMQDVLTTITLSDGTLYDCVKAEPLPVMKSPGMEGHTLADPPPPLLLRDREKVPDSDPKHVGGTAGPDGKASEIKVISLSSMLEGQSCPEGSVPIRRLTAAEDRRRMENMPKKPPPPSRYPAE